MRPEIGSSDAPDSEEDSGSICTPRATVAARRVVLEAVRLLS